MAVRRLPAIASRNDATAERNAFARYGWQATNPINNFRAHGGVPWTEGPRGRGAGEHRRARCRVRQGHRARHDRAAFGPPRKLSADAPDPFSAGDANREPFRLPAVETLPVLRCASPKLQ